MFATGIKELAHAFIDLIYPSVCVLCREGIKSGSPLVCEQCLENLQVLRPPHCFRCGAPIHEKAFRIVSCNACPPDKLYYQKARSILSFYDPNVRELIHALKYNYQTSLAEPLGEILLNGFLEMFEQQYFDAIVPVPLHKRRRRNREYNQSALLCETLSSGTGIPIREDIVYRSRNTPRQTKQSRHTRLKNVYDAFSLYNPSGLEGFSILVVDDVFTTGSTVNEVCKTLKKGGASYLAVLTLARTISKDPNHPFDIQESIKWDRDN